jgi:hypothetical protein
MIDPIVCQMEEFCFLNTDLKRLLSQLFLLCFIIEDVL